MRPGTAQGSGEPSSVSVGMFIFLLVVAAKLLPLEELRPVIEQYGRNEMGIGRGVLSAFFDNIP